jgi:carbon-monoxide dehydrogenase medium subunit
MIPAAFDYVRAASVDDALALLARHGGEAKLLAGGHSLLPLMKLRLARPERLIDIGRLPELRGGRELEGGRVSIGALTTYAELLEDPQIGHLGVMVDALPRIGDVQVRNRGTIGGSIAHADPASDMPAVLLALDAEVVALSAARGERLIPIDAFFEGPFATALAEDELLTAIRLPPASSALASAYQALGQPASGYPIAGVAVGVGAEWRLVRIAVTGVGDHPYRALAAEAALVSADGGTGEINSAIDLVTDGVEVNGDIHADPIYRAAMAREMARRAFELAVARLP